MSSIPASGFNYILRVLFLLATLFSAAAQAFTVPLMNGHVSDYGNLLGAQGETLDQKLIDYEKRTGHRINVLTVSDPEGFSVDDFADTVQTVWTSREPKLNLNASMLIVVTAYSHRARIRFGPRFPSAATKQRAQDVINTQMNPRFVQGDYVGGLNNGIDTLMAMTENRDLPQIKQFSELGWQNGLIQLVLGFFGVSFFMAFTLYFGGGMTAFVVVFVCLFAYMFLPGWAEMLMIAIHLAIAGRLRWCIIRPNADRYAFRGMDRAEMTKKEKRRIYQRVFWGWGSGQPADYRRRGGARSRKRISEDLE